MSYDLEGTVKEIHETKTFGSGFTKREFIVTVVRGPEDKYPQHIKLSVVKDKCAVLDKFKPGQAVKVSFDLRGSEYQGRYYTDLQAWKIAPAGAASAGAAGAAAADEPFMDEAESGDDIPF